MLRSAALVERGCAARRLWLREQEDVVVTIGEVQSEVVVEDGKAAGSSPPADVSREQLRETVRELLEEMLERHLRVEERR